MDNNKIMDIKLELNDDGNFDFVLENGGLLFDYSIETLIIYLIFTNALDIEYPLNFKEGWKGGELSSFVWQFKHRTATEDTALDLKNEIRNALQSLIDDNICSNIVVNSEISSSRISITIEYFSVAGNDNGKYNIAFQLSGN